MSDAGEIEGEVGTEAADAVAAGAQGVAGSVWDQQHDNVCVDPDPPASEAQPGGATEGQAQPFHLFGP